MTTTYSYIHGRMHHGALSLSCSHGDCKMKGDGRLRWWGFCYKKNTVGYINSKSLVISSPPPVHLFLRSRSTTIFEAIATSQHSLPRAPSQEIIHKPNLIPPSPFVKEKRQERVDTTLPPARTNKDRPHHPSIHPSLPPLPTYLPCYLPPPPSPRSTTWAAAASTASNAAATSSGATLARTEATRKTPLTRFQARRR